MFDFLIGIHIVGMVLILYSLIVMFRGESTYAQKLLIYIMLANLVHNAGYLLELQATSLESAFMSVKFEYLGIAVFVIFFMMFIRHYCGFVENKLLERSMLICSLISVILVWTTPAHSLYYKNVEFVEEGLYPHLILTYGPFFYVQAAVAIVLPWIIIMYSLITSVKKEPQAKKRRNLIYVIFGTAFELIVFFIYGMGFFGGYDPTAVSMAFMLSFMVTTIWNRKDYDLTRAAANTVLNTLEEAVVTVDEYMKVLTYNQSAKEMFSTLEIRGNIKDVEHFPQDMIGAGDKTEFVLNGKRYEGHLNELKDVDRDIRGYTFLFADVTNTYEYIANIKEMRERAEVANRAKSDFLANMSHEIRTPMNAVVGLSELIIEESRGRKMYDYACNIKSAALNLLSIINDVLDLSKVEAGKMQLVNDDYHLQVLVQDTVNLIEVAAAQKGLKLKVELDENLPSQLHGDEGRIRQVLVNLLNNAIKFTRKGYVKFRISGECTEPDVLDLCFEVEDTGIGIKEEDMENIFAVFQQLDMNKNRKTEGSGLGLAITKQIVQLMDGAIDVSSEYGVGTTFVVKLKQKVVSEKTIQEQPVTREDLQVTSRKRFTCKDYRVLVVDDNVINRRVAIKMLDDYQLQLDDVDSGQSAIELVKQKQYDMILMDHMMPEMDGVEATRIIRTECGENGARVVIIALTANVIEGAKEMFLNNGFQDFLAKPYERLQLHELMNTWVPEEQKQYLDGVVENNKVSEDEIAEIFMHGVDVRAAIEHNSGNLEDYLDLLQMFYIDGMNKRGYMDQLLVNKDFKNYGIEAHALKSAAANIGAKGLSEEAKKHEMAAKQGQAEYIVEHRDALATEYLKILKEIEEVLKKKQYGKFAEKDTSELKPIDEVVLLEKVKASLHNLERFKSKEAAAIVEDLLQHSIRDSIKMQLEEIQTLFSMYEDDQAEEKLKELIKELQR